MFLLLINQTGEYHQRDYENEICGIMAGFIGEDRFSDILAYEIMGHVASTFIVRNDGSVLGDIRTCCKRRCQD